jgi:hypothetical protein
MVGRDSRKPPRIRRSGSRVPKIPIVVGIAVVVILGSFLYLSNLPSDQILMDWHVKLTFFDSRYYTNSTPPADIGVNGGLWQNHTLDRYGPQGYAPISTRDTSGTLYIQSKVYEFYTFKDFFNIWGQQFNHLCTPLPPNFPSNSPYCAGPGETVVYDSNNNSMYDSGDIVVSNSTAPSLSTPLGFDPQIKYIDANNNGRWDPNETIVYDYSNRGTYQPNDPLIYGQLPIAGTLLKTDPRIRFVDSNSNGVWDPPKLPPILSDGTNERCINPGYAFANNKDWLIILYAPSGLIAGDCLS